MSSQPRGGRAAHGVIVVAIVAIALALGLGTAAAKERDKAVIDKVDVRPSPLHGLARVRALISAFELLGGRIPHDHPPIITVKLGGAKQPFVTGLSRNAEVELAVVLVVSSTDAYKEVLDTIREELKNGLLAELEKLGPRVQIAVIGYDSTTNPQKRLGPVAAARTALDGLSPEDVTTEVALVRAVEDAVAMVSRAKPKQAGAMVRPVVVIVSDGDGIPTDEIERAKVTEAGLKADKLGVRIHTLGFSPEDKRRSLLTLGELSRRSNGTFRWVQTMKGWDTALKQLSDQLVNQYVVTFLAPLEEVQRKKLSITIENGGDKIEAAPVILKEPKCVKEICEADSYCVRDKCIKRRLEAGGGGALRWVLIIGGAIVGLGVVLFVIGTILSRRGSRPPAPAPLPGAHVVAGTGMHAHAPAPVQAPPAAPPAMPGGPVLIVMSGPDAGRQIPLHHGFLLGKAPGSHLGLGHDATASTNHAQITFDGASWTLTDLGSTNGTFANGNRVTAVKLYPGMTVRVGSTDVRFWQA